MKNLAGQTITIHHVPEQILIFGYVIPEQWVLKIDGHYMACYTTQEAAEMAAQSDYIQFGQFN